LGVERIVSVSACGSLREDYVPGDIVIPDQLFDFTRGRERSFFEGGLVAHIGVADPYCEDLSPQIHSAVKSTKAKVHSGGNFITIEGPRFSTRAESNVYRTWGMDLIGMTTSPEAFLAREAEMCYGVMAHITDYDVWHISEAPVTADMVFETIKKNTSIAQEAIVNLAANLDNNMTCNCHNALAEAFTTQPKNASSEKRKDLSLLLNKYWK
ncbi:MAG: MTAP family purine nucleoside phosphorylase, partial [Anaerolineae bacterium]|nr:MTAP family purine nucleoside phosphorylase [Anaerolineae bacterium]